MKRRRFFFLLLFVTFSALHVLMEMLEVDSYWVHYVKPFIIPMLMLHYIFAVPKSNKLYLIALTFSFIGDSFLMYSDDSSFLIGIGSFWITQIIYIFLFVKLTKGIPWYYFLIAGFVFLIYSLGLLSTLLPDLGNLLWPVVTYAVSIAIFGIISTVIWLYHRSFSFLLMWGAIIFILSDSMIALEKFYFGNYFFGPLIMITYVAAQYLIARFMILGNRENELN